MRESVNSRQKTGHSLNNLHETWIAANLTLTHSKHLLICCQVVSVLMLRSLDSDEVHHPLRTSCSTYVSSRSASTHHNTKGHRPRRAEGTLRVRSSVWSARTKRPGLDGLASRGSLWKVSPYMLRASRPPSPTTLPNITCSTVAVSFRSKAG